MRARSENGERARRAASVVVLALAMSLPFACDTPPSATCAAGTTCDCPPGSFCRFTCDGPDCSFFCPPSASCGFICDAGGCSAHCWGSPACDMGCPGGGCDMHCIKGAYCKLHKCPDCPLTCDADSTCIHDNR